MAIIDTATFFAKTLIPTVGGRNASRRVPFTFSSTKRLLQTGVLGTSDSRSVAKWNADYIMKRQLREIEGTAQTIDIAGTLGLSSAVSAGPNMPVISMMVNPSTVTWNQPKRWVKRDTMEGSVFYHFSNSNGQNNDILTLSFAGSTGNINTQNGVIAATDNAADIKLRIWHELYNLTREPMLLDGGIRNDFFITYRTVLMPMPITFIGFFNTVLQFNETADKPFNRDYSFQFTVTNTSPSLDELSSKINSALLLTGPISAAKTIL